MSLPIQFFYTPNLSDENIRQLCTSNSTPWRNFSIWNLGIQGPPGLQFSLGNGNIQLGPTGIYEINCLGYDSIQGASFTFTEDSVKKLLKNNPSSYLLIDIYPYVPRTVEGSA